MQEPEYTRSSEIRKKRVRIYTQNHAAVGSIAHIYIYIYIFFCFSFFFCINMYLFICVCLLDMQITNDAFSLLLFV